MKRRGSDAGRSDAAKKPKQVSLMHAFQNARSAHIHRSVSEPVARIDIRDTDLDAAIKLSLQAEQRRKSHEKLMREAIESGLLGGAIAAAVERSAPLLKSDAVEQRKPASTPSTGEGKENTRGEALRTATSTTTTATTTTTTTTNSQGPAPPTTTSTTSMPPPAAVPTAKTASGSVVRTASAPGRLTSKSSSSSLPGDTFMTDATAHDTINAASSAARSSARTYYVRNFEVILHTIVPRNSEQDGLRYLFNEAELNCVEAFRCLSVDAKRLYVRLFRRKLGWHRMDSLKLKYEESIAIDSAVAELARAGLLDVGSAAAVGLDDSIRALRKDELRDVAHELGVAARTSERRGVIADRIRAYGNKTTLTDVFRRGASSKASASGSVRNGGGGADGAPETIDLLDSDSGCDSGSGEDGRGGRESEGDSDGKRSTGRRKSVDGTRGGSSRKHSDSGNGGSSGSGSDLELVSVAPRRARSASTNESTAMTTATTSTTTKTTSTAAAMKSEVKEPLATAPRSTTTSTTSTGCAGDDGERFQSERAAEVVGALSEVLGECVRLAEGPRGAFQRAEFLYFITSNTSHGHSETNSDVLILIDMGANSYADYVIDRSVRVFQSRQHVLEYCESLAHIQLMDAALESGTIDDVATLIEVAKLLVGRAARRVDIHQTSAPDTEHASAASGGRSGKLGAKAHGSGKQRGPSSKAGGGSVAKLPSYFEVVGPPPEPQPFEARFSAAWVYARVLTYGCRLYEQARRYEEAVEAYSLLLRTPLCTGRRGEWWLRLSVDLGHLKRKADSLAAAEAGIEDPFVAAGSLWSLQHRVVSLCKPPLRYKGRPDLKARVKRQFPCVTFHGELLSEVGSARRHVWLGDLGTRISVEELAIVHYEKDGWSGIHCEGGVLRTLFGLFMWEAIFDSTVPGVFQTPCQSAPLDLYTENFYKFRQGIIGEILEELRLLDVSLLLQESYKSHFGTECVGVSWAYSLDVLDTVAVGIGGPKLAELFELMAKDYRSRSGGLPDLMLFKRDSETGEAAVKLSEVKGPTDSLSDQQKDWLTVLLGIGIDAEVCKVLPTNTRASGRK